MNSVIMTIIIIALLIGPFFALAGISLGGFIYHGVKKNPDSQKKFLKVLVPTAIAWLVLIAVNSALIIVVVIHNGGDLIAYFSQLFQFLDR